MGLARHSRSPRTERTQLAQSAPDHCAFRWVREMLRVLRRSLEGCMSVRSTSTGSAYAAGALLVGAAVAVLLGVYARVHQASYRPLFLLGFSGMLQLKTWLATLSLALVFVQVLT